MTMPAFFHRTLSIAAIACVAVVAASDGARAQSSARVSFGGDSMQRLTANMSGQARTTLAAYLAAPDSAATRPFDQLMNDATAADFVLAALGRDPLATLRRRAVSGLTSSSRPHFLTHPGTFAALRDRVRNDPDTVVIRSALTTAAQLSSALSGVRQALNDRIAAGGITDTSMARLLQDEEETLVMAERSMVAPPFVRTPPPPFAVAPPSADIRVLAFGDFGQAHLPRSTHHQVPLAATMRSYHAANRFTFGITTGDNFYGTSFPSPDDPNWKISWSNLYDALGIPFYISLGNHDWGERAGPLSQFIYARTSNSWKFPSFYYTFTAGSAQFFAVNTNALTPRHLSWLRAELAKSTARWKIVYGHFPAYEQTNYSVAGPEKLLVPIFKEFRVDAYLCGHHHTMQHWQVDGVEYFVTGAGGAGNYGLGDTLKVAPNRRFMKSVPGFADMSITASTFNLKFIGMDSKVLYEYTRKK